MAYASIDFHTGDIVRFREWDDMKNEFGTIFYGHVEVICCRHNFTSFMRHLCGTTATLSLKGVSSVLLTDFESDGPAGFSYSYDMIEPADVSGGYSFSEKEFMDLIK